jgi:hypothetical protein
MIVVVVNIFGLVMGAGGEGSFSGEVWGGAGVNAGGVLGELFVVDVF